MKNHTDEIWSSLSSIVEDRSILDIKRTASIMESCSDVLLNELCAALLSCNEQSLELQRRETKGQTAFITFSFLDSSILTGTNDLRIDFYDERFLVDIAEACDYFSFRHLISFCQESVDVICQEAKKRFTRFMDNEKAALSRMYKGEVLYKMVGSICSLCLLHPNMEKFWSQFTVSENCVLTYGRYLHGQQPFLKFSQTRGVTAL
jgi:hypothetical protein